MDSTDDATKFVHLLSVLNTEITLSGQLNLNNLAVTSENFFSKLINMLYDYNTKNINFTQQNAPTIDLIDENKKILVQVTAQANRQKVQKTLSDINLSPYSKENYHLFFIFIGEQKKQLSTKDYSSTSTIIFDKKNDLLFTKDLCNHFITLDSIKRKQILAYIQSELPLINTDGSFKNRKDIASEINILLAENFSKWQNLGPSSNIAIADPGSNMNLVWEQEKKQIIENNDRIKTIFDKSNKKLFTADERQIFNEFFEHAGLFKTNNTLRIDRHAYKKFPANFQQMITNILEEN